MKYLFEFWAKEPIAENMKKIYEIEAERRKKGEAFVNIVQYYILGEPRVIMIADTEPIKVAKWCKDYMAVMDWTVSPLMERSDIDKL